MTTRAARLFLVANTLDLGVEGEPADLQHSLPLGTLEVASSVTHWVAENAKNARAFLKRVHAVVPLALPLQELQINEWPRPRKGSGLELTLADMAPLLAPARAGHNMALISDTGLPAVADPGALLVAAAHEAGVPVVPTSGPSSLVLALAASGFNGQSFAFVGYLPTEAQARASRLRELEAHSRRTGQTQLMIETPYRNAALLQALLETLSPSTRLSVSCGLTLPDGWTRSDPVSRWRARPVSMPDRLPAVFALLGA